MAKLTPVDGNPFAATTGVKLTPVDEDPFASDQGAAQKQSAYSDLEKASEDVNYKITKDPNYKPTEEDWNKLSKYRDAVEWEGNKLALNTATLGLSDRAIAAIGWLQGKGYDKTLKEVQNIREQYKKSNPGLAMASEAVGAVAPGVVGGGAGALAAKGVRAAGLSAPAAHLANVVTAGGTTGALVEASKTKDFSDYNDLAKKVIDGAKIGALTGYAGAVAAKAGQTAVKYGGGLIADAAGKISGFKWAARRWAHKVRRQDVADLLKRNGITNYDDAVDFLRRRFAERTLVGESTPTGYVMKEALDPDVVKAVGHAAGDRTGIENAARTMVQDQTSGADRFVRRTLGQRFSNSPASHLARLERQATTDMTPGYEAVVRDIVHAPRLQSLLMNDRNARSHFMRSVNDAISRGRLPASVRNEAENWLNPNPTAAAVPQADRRLSIGVIESLLRRAGGRVQPLNKVDVGTDQAVVNNIRSALMHDAADNPSIAQLLVHRAEHTGAKDKLDAFGDAYGIFSKNGLPRLQAEANVQRNVWNNSAETRLGAESWLRHEISRAQNGNLRPLAEAITPENRATLAGALRGNTNAVDTITEHLTERGRRALYAKQLGELANSGVVPTRIEPEAFARGAITAGMAPNMAVLRAIQVMTRGMNEARANEVLRHAAGEATPNVQAYYEALAKQGYDRAAMALIKQRMAAIASSYLGTRVFGDKTKKYGGE